MLYPLLLSMRPKIVVVATMADSWVRAESHKVLFMASKAGKVKIPINIEQITTNLRSYS